MGRVRLLFKNRFLYSTAFFVCILGILFLALLSYYFISFQNKIYPNITIGGINVSGLTIEESNKVLSEHIETNRNIKIVGESLTHTLSLKDMDFSYNINASSERAYYYTRTGNIFYDTLKRLQLLKSVTKLGLLTQINEEKINKFISVVSGQNSIEPVYPDVSLVKGAVVVNPGAPGVEVDQKLLRAIIGNNLAFSINDDIQIPIVKIDKTLTKDQAEKVKQDMQKLVGKSLSAKFEYETFTINDQELIDFVNPLGGFDANLINQKIDKIAVQIDRQPQNPKFKFENEKVVEFQPSKDGISTKKNDFSITLIDSLNKLINEQEKNISIDIPIIKTAPEITTEKVNNLGIKELVGRGVSTYYHSIPSRVHNVSLAASRINGTLVPPGETFSFNQSLGDVSQFTGYQQAYIISGGKTILGDGGGVCQVSTTLFRSVLNAGLPVLERSAHAYRVGYYEQNSPPGLDATVYGPSPDLKFTNDTGSHLLIQAIADPKNYSLTVELYGTNDGRTVVVSKPVITNVIPAPEDRYQDDPNLPTGVIKQIEHKVSGAKVTFLYSVTKNGEQIYNKTFVSNYRPWQAVYLKGTGPSR